MIREYLYSITIDYDYWKSGLNRIFLMTFRLLSYLCRILYVKNVLFTKDVFDINLSIFQDDLKFIWSQALNTDHINQCKIPENFFKF